MSSILIVEDNEKNMKLVRDILAHHGHRMIEATTGEEGVRLANATSLGLQAGIFTARVDRAIMLARRLHFGGVVINETPTFRADQMPYGGVKQSGNTREGPRAAVREMTVPKLVVLQLPGQ